MEAEADLHVVTGAFSYTGRFIAHRLLAQGQRVRTLTNHVRDETLAQRVEVAPLDFSDYAGLVRSMQGAATLYNTYWVRFPHGGASFADAVMNIRTLLAAANDACVGRVVHISVSNPSADSPLPYYRGKALAEEAVVRCGLPYAIVRPTLIYGRGDILINNIAWLLRRFPFFAVPGSGRYRLQPVSGEDTARLAVEAAGESGNVTLDAAGPDVLTFDELVRYIAGAVGSSARIVHLPPGATLALGNLVGRMVRDVILTPEEARGLMDELLVSHEPPRGHDRIAEWIGANGAALGRHYASELARHFR